MPIEFRCASCQALLRVSDDRAGKLIRCPHCQGVMMAAAAAAAPPNPFADLPPKPAPPAVVNPYAAPKSTVYDPRYAHGFGAPSREVAAAKLQGPAIGMMVYAVLAMAVGVLNLILVGVTGPQEVMLGPAPETEAEKMGQMIGFYLGYFGAGVATVMMLVLLFAAWKMLRAESYAWAMTASILSVLPCSACCLIGLIFGVWGLVALNDPQVKLYFSQLRRA